MLEGEVVGPVSLGCQNYGILAYAERYRILGIAIVAPPPNLLLNSDILGILATFNAFALEKSIKQVNMKLFRSSTLLISFEIYITRLQFALQRPNIRLKDIFIGAMLEMLLWKPVTATSSYCIVQKLTEGALEARPYLMKVPSDPGLQHTETELNEVEVRRV